MCEGLLCALFGWWTCLVVVVGLDALIIAGRAVLMRGARPGLDARLRGGDAVIVDLKKLRSMRSEIVSEACGLWRFLRNIWIYVM